MTTGIVTLTNPFDRAIERADLLNPTVIWAGGLEFFVSGTGMDSFKDTYHVILTGQLTTPSLLDANCTCKAGENYEKTPCCTHRAAAWLMLKKLQTKKGSPELLLEYVEAAHACNSVATQPEPEPEPSCAALTCTNPACFEVEQISDLCPICQAEYAEYELLTAYENFANLHPKAA